MTRGGGRVRPCSAADARALAGYAAAYLAAAKQLREAGGPGADHVATGNAVLAAIAASDAVCGALLGERPRGEDHRQAVRMLGTVRRGPGDDGTWAAALADDLAQALDAKAESHYGVAGIGRDAQVRSLRAAERLVAAAREVTRR
ncbi:MAG TPA: hypothetical protein VFQ85_02395 [Mycobacteriales bacterium]|nr:hypothetical protein [Mycobacteriales bacterium]